MADQVSVALDNARLFAESEQALEATRRAYGQLSSQPGLTYCASLPLGYGYAPARCSACRGEWPPEMIEALRTGSHRAPACGIQRPGQGIRLVARVYGGACLGPASESGQGVVGCGAFIRDSGDGAWRPRKMELLRRLVDQLGMALESAQLYQETQRARGLASRPFARSQNECANLSTSRRFCRALS